MTCEQCGHEEPASCSLQSVFLFNWHNLSRHCSLWKYRDNDAFASRGVSIGVEAKAEDTDEGARGRCRFAQGAFIPWWCHTSYPEICCLQVSEKCPECGHLEAYSKEMQVGWIVWPAHVLAQLWSSCAVQMKAPLFCTLYMPSILLHQLCLTPISLVRRLQTRLACQQLSMHLYVLAVWIMRVSASVP